MIPGLVKIEKKKVPARKAEKDVPNPFKPGELMNRPAKPAYNKVKVRALKLLKDMVKLPPVMSTTLVAKVRQQGVAGHFMTLQHPEFHAASVRPRASSAETLFQSMLIIPGRYLSMVSPLTRSSAASISAVNSPSARCRLVL